MLRGDVTGVSADNNSALVLDGHDGGAHGFLLVEEAVVLSFKHQFKNNLNQIPNLSIFADQIAHSRGPPESTIYLPLAVASLMNI